MRNNDPRYYDSEEDDGYGRGPQPRRRQYPDDYDRGGYNAPRGQRDRDWADDFDTRNDGRVRRQAPSRRYDYDYDYNADDAAYDRPPRRRYPDDTDRRGYADSDRRYADDGRRYQPAPPPRRRYAERDYDRDDDRYADAPPPPPRRRQAAPPPPPPPPRRKASEIRQRFYAPDPEETEPQTDSYEPPRRNSSRSDYDYDSDYYDSDDRLPMDESPKNFRQRHPVLMNAIYIVLTVSVVLWLLMCFLDFWTFHGEERVVPDLKGQVYNTAVTNADAVDLRPVISDSVFDSYSPPGTVVEQIPIPGAKIKKGGSVYLTIVAFSPKLITVPDFYNVSVRQARSMFEGLGVKEIREVPVPSEYGGLVLGAKYNGMSLQPGARIPVSSVVTLEVGSGYADSIDGGAAVDTTAIDTVIEELNIE